MPRAVLLPLALLGLLTGCLSPAPTTPLRWFEPALPSPAAVPPGADAASVHLRPVTAAEHLDQRPVWRASAVELGFHENWRWAEPPATYVERALGDALAADGRVRRTETLLGCSLTVRLLAFDHLVGPSPGARVALQARLTDGTGEARLQREFVATTPLAGDDPAELARALGDALGRASSALVDAVAADLAHPAGQP